MNHFILETLKRLWLAEIDSDKAYELIMEFGEDMKIKTPENSYEVLDAIFTLVKYERINLQIADKMVWGFITKK